MNISEIIKKLQEIQNERGDIVVFNESGIINDELLEVGRADVLIDADNLPFGVRCHNDVVLFNSHR